MGTKELLEFEALGYVEGRNIEPPAFVQPTRRGHDVAQALRIYKIKELAGYKNLVNPLIL
jgi:hypothetical protein